MAGNEKTSAKTRGEKSLPKAQEPRNRDFTVPVSSLLAAGVLLVLGAVLLEHPVISEDATGGHSVIFNMKTLVSFLKEAGFALLIAWGVSMGIERQSRKKEHESNEKNREGIARDVVSAVYGLNHDPAYVKTVIEHTLQSRIVRELYDCEYVLEQFTPEEEARLGIKSGKLIKFTQISKYTFRNVSKKSITNFEVTYAIPTRASGTLQAFTGIQRASINGTWLSKDEIEGALTTVDYKKAYRWPRSMPGEGKINVIIHCVSVKELSDNEIWRCLHPTYGGMDLIVRVRVPGVRYGMTSYTATDMVETYELAKDDGGEKTQTRWEIPGPILPNESVVVWWRSPEDDGPVDANTLSMTSQSQGTDELSRS